MDSFLYCQKCGAPVRMFDGVWMATTPPPVYPSCECWNLAQTFTTSTIQLQPTSQVEDLEKKVEELEKELEEALERNRVLYERLIASEERYSKFMEQRLATVIRRSD